MSQYAYHITYVLANDAEGLLPLADEYHMENLGKLCVDELMKQAYPSLEIVSLVERYAIPELLEKSIEGCANNISPEDLDTSHEGAVDWKVTDASLLRIYRYLLIVNQEITLLPMFPNIHKCGIKYDI